MTRLLILTVALLTSYCQIWAHPTQAQHQQQSYLGERKIHIRPATEADFDDITTVLVDAFRSGPTWRYVSPDQDEYLEYTWNCTREKVEDVLRHASNTTFANVISVPTGHDAADRQRQRNERVVAVASWRIIEPGTEHADHDGVDTLGAWSGNAKCSDQLDVNQTRSLDYNRQFLAAMVRYVWSLPQKQMYLAVLGTHPDWDGHGFGAAHCHWGMDMARGMGVPTTLMATPAGWPLYDSLGFGSVANVTIETLGKLENLWYEYMRYDI